MNTLAASWWAFVLRGILAILFGLLTFLLPGITLLTLVFLFGFTSITEGVLNLVGGLRARRGSAEPRRAPWWAAVIHGSLAIVVGALAFLLPGLTALALLYLIAAWALVGGVLSVVAAVQLRKEIEGEWWLALSGLLSVVFGIALVLFPGAGALALVLWIGAYALVLGVLLVALGLRLRGRLPGERRGPHEIPVTRRGSPA